MTLFAVQRDVSTYAAYAYGSLGRIYIIWIKSIVGGRMSMDTVFPKETYRIWGGVAKAHLPAVLRH